MVTEEDVIAKLREVYDPEVMVNVYDLGLIYKISINHLPDGDEVLIKMTLTTPTCPLGPLLMKMVEKKLNELDVKKVRVYLTFDPPWDKSMIKWENLRKKDEGSEN